MNESAINAAVRMPVNPLPVIAIGAGGIVEEAHLPAYKKAGWAVRGIFDIEPSKARKLAALFGIPTVYDSLDEALASPPGEVVFDVAVPASQLENILSRLPDGANVLMQKPFGEDLKQARRLLTICESKKLTAGVNFQMKLIPSISAAKEMIDQGMIGELHDMEIRMNIHHPWELWGFLFGLPRMEMLYHSIHYMDMIRYFFGMPERLYAKTFQHPRQMQLASTRSIIIFDYQRPVRAFVNTNHGHYFGLKHQDSFVKWEGTRGAIKATLGKNINFPKGEADDFEYILLDDRQPEWKRLEIQGVWYPDAFIATMADLQCAIERREEKYTISVREAYDTMRLVEAAYISSEQGGALIPG